MRWTQFLLAGVTLLATAALAPQATAQSCIEPPSGLIAWWTGDGNATDSVSGFHGTPMNGAGFAPGLVGDAFSLDQIDAEQDDHVILPRHALDGLADMSVEFWVNTTDADQGGLLSVANGNVGGDNDLLMLYSPTGLLLIVKQTGLASVPVFLNDGAWHHVAFVREADSGHLYIDGVLADSRAYPVGPLDVGPRGLMLGQEQDCLGGCFDPSQAFAGLIDEMSVYGRALSTDEVVAVFGAGSAGKCKPPEMPAGEDLVERIEGLESEVDALSDLLMELETRMESMESQTAGKHKHRRRHKRRHERDHHDDH